MARRSRAKCGGEFTRNKSSNQEPQAIRAMRMVATQAGNTMIWMMVASLARVISTLPTMSKLLRCQAARAWIRWSRWGRHCWRWCFVDGKTQRRSVESGDASGDNGGGNRAETGAASDRTDWGRNAVDHCGQEPSALADAGAVNNEDDELELANAYAVVSDGSTELKEEQPSRRQLRRREAAERRSGTRGDENPMKPVQRAGRGRRWCCFDGKSRTQQRGLVKRVKVPVDP
ncbi:hypothetical protein Pcac1_g12670 [Phytophthora cactorum]|nr:hypothetical protein Pcac1_g12670 [Phytophthora cactorum]KAG3158717.1 hypothetical protein C6341_g14325 [Phytophthora cactorum]KAG3201663.1 hypothetical protein PC128_g3741 [Phytophthora cactorum]